MKVSKCPKNNITLDGLSVLIPTETGTNLAPILYLNDYYEDYLNTGALEQVLDEIAYTYKVNNYNMVQNTFNTEQIVDFEQVKDKIFPKLINADMNKDLLADRPHTMFHNLAVIYSIEFVFNRKDARVDVNNFLFEKYGITTEELHNLAVSNQERMKRPVIQNLYDVVSKMVEMTDAELAPVGLSQYVLTNEKSYYGASLILHDDILQKASAKLNGDFFIIPSSVHEVILLPEEGVVPEELNQMIQEINGDSNVISKTDVLSNNAYHYNHREHSLEIVENSLLQFKKNKEKIKRNKEEAKTVRKYGMER